MHIGLFFGSYNPIHIGHMAIANYMICYTEMQEIWMVVSPQNPLKNKNQLLNQNNRLLLVNLAIDDFSRIKSSSIEFNLSQPSYTINTLAHLSEKYPQHQFSLIMGQDNLQNFNKWKKKINQVVMVVAVSRAPCNRRNSKTLSNTWFQEWGCQKPFKTHVIKMCYV